MEKIALIMTGGSRNMVISDKTVARLKTLGEVVINEGSTGKEDVIKAISGATVAITSWGNTGIDAEILAACPDLKLVCHAAGSVKPIVTDALWKKGVRVVSSACPLGHGVAETALGFTISASKNFYNLNASLHNGGWEEGKDAIGDLFDLTVGVISAGWAGAHYIELLQNFNVDVLLYDPFVSDERAAALGCQKGFARGAAAGQRHRVHPRALDSRNLPYVQRGNHRDDEGRRRPHQHRARLAHRRAGAVCAYEGRQAQIRLP